MWSKFLVFLQRELGETSKRDVHLRLGTFRNWLCARDVWPGSTFASYLRWWYAKLLNVQCSPKKFKFVPTPEVFTYSCFGELMKRMASNFPHGGAMDTHFANMRSLIQILDADIFDLMHQNGDYTHFYFCYRWFLLDFKRGNETNANGIYSFCLMHRAGVQWRVFRLGDYLGC